VQRYLAANGLAIELTLDGDAGGVDLALDFAGVLDDSSTVPGKNSSPVMREPAPRCERPPVLELF
jgi:hypothetical protein